MNDQLDAFETALLTELRTVVAEQASRDHSPKNTRAGNARVGSSPTSISTASLAEGSTRGRTSKTGRRFAAGSLLVAAAAAVTVGGIGPWHSAPPAYAVDRAPDGDVIVTVHRFDDAHGLEEELRAEGVHADVSYAQAPSTTGSAAPTASTSPDGQPQSPTGEDAEPPGAGTASIGDNRSFSSGNPGEAALAVQWRREGANWVLRLDSDELTAWHFVIHLDSTGGLSLGTEARVRQ